MVRNHNSISTKTYCIARIFRIVLPSALLRAANVRVMGSGQGSVATEDIVAELPALVAEIAAGGLTVAADPVPLSDVEDAWSAPAAAGRRVVLTP